MRAISIETLAGLRGVPNQDAATIRTLDWLINVHCQELQEPWIPVDENAPKDRFILCWIDDLQSKYILTFSTIRNTWLDQGLRPFMEPDLYQELPDDPVMPIHKPELPR